MYCDIHYPHRLLFIALHLNQISVTKYVPELAMLHLISSIAPLILNLNTTWQWAVSFMPQPLYLCEVSFWWSLDRRVCGVPRAVWMLWRREISVVLLGIRPQFLGFLAHNLSDYQSRDPISVGARFSAPIQTGRRTQPAICTIGTVSSPELKWPGRGFGHPPHLALG